MKEIILDTETTGISVREGHRIVEIACLELENLIPTGNKFHYCVNHERKVSDKEDRSRNVIIYGVEEEENEKLKQKVETILVEIGEKPVLKDFGRVGVKKSDVKSPRPIKFTLSNSDHVNQVLRSARQLHSKEGYRSVYICPDRTAEERRAHKKLMELLKEKRAAEKAASNSASQPEVDENRMLELQEI